MGNSAIKPTHAHPEAEPFHEVCPAKANSTVRQSYKSSSKKKDLLGEGGFSKVMLGIHVETKEKVAIKITSDRDKEARHEVELLKFIGEHKNIVHLMQAYRYNKKLYLVFEYCPNGDLMDLLVDIDRIEEKDARLVARQLMNAVDFIHKKQIAHRDIKGENILYMGDLKSNTLECKLADFGAATYFTKHDQVFTKKIGSSCYVAPEVLIGKYYPSKADIWSTGATIFALLNGDPPFHSPVHELTIQRVQENKLELPITITKHVSSCGQHFILSLMTRFAWKRPVSEDVVRHPWISEKLGMDELPDMELPAAEKADITIDHILRNPAVHSDVKRRSRKESRTPLMMRRRRNTND